MPCSRSLVALLIPFALALPPAATPAAPAVVAAPQEPKAGNSWYEDAVDLGFKMKAPKDWSFVPGSPLERNMVGKYAGSDLHLGKDALLQLALYLVKFDRRKAKGPPEKRQFGDMEVELSNEGLKNIEEWVTKAMDEGMQWRKAEGPKPFKGSLDGKLYFFDGVSSKFYGTNHEPQPVRAFAAVFALTPEVDVAMVGVGPGDKKKWRGFENAYENLAKTLQPLAMNAVAAPVGKDPRSQKRAKLEAEIARSPGWALYETPNYFIISAYDDKGFIEELKLRLEAIRLVYEKDYPPELARMIKVRPKPEAAGEGKPGDEPGEGEPNEGAPAPEGEPAAEEQDPTKTVSGISALELGRLSVVRVCKNKEQYMSYGAPPSSSGYFSSMEQELVTYDDKADEGRDATWAVMNHEGFHQYTFAFFGNTAPHSWYNEGTGDYYSGFEFNTKTKRFKAEKNIGRQDNLLIIRERYVPLKEFVRWTKAQYYGSGGVGKNGQPMEGWASYAQGWSLIYFLRTGEKAKGWQKEWGSILDTYVNKLLETGDTEQAVEAAYKGIDWDAFEKCWLGYMM
jgi:hypothetical protein